MLSNISKRNAVANSPEHINPQFACPAVVVANLHAPFTLLPPATERQSQVVATSPHSGRNYPQHFLHQAAVALDDLRKVEDAAMDKLLTFQPLPCAVLMAEFPRSFVDVNRNSDELDPRMFDGPIGDIMPTASRYLRAGLGMIPSKAANQQNIYSAPLPAQEADFRRNHFYRPYHDALRAELTKASNVGPALLLDCHSMPSSLFGVDADVIIGSNHGVSAEAWMVDEAVSFFSREGLKTRLNTPFSGGFVTKHYGQPAHNISALQIEVCRSLYLDETKVTLNDNWQATASVLARFIMRMDELTARHR